MKYCAQSQAWLADAKTLGLLSDKLLSEPRSWAGGVPGPLDELHGNFPEGQKALEVRVYCNDHSLPRGPCSGNC